MYRQTNFQTTSNIITFDITREEAHKDVTFELTIGHHPMSVRVFLLERGDGYVHYNNNNNNINNSTSLVGSGSHLFSGSGSTTFHSGSTGIGPSEQQQQPQRSEAVTKALSQFAAMNRGFSITAKDLLASSSSQNNNNTIAAINTSGIMFYANDTPEQRICDYRHQVRVRSRSDTTTTRGPGEIFSTDPLVQLSAANGKLYMAMHCVEAISNVSLVCYLDPPRTSVADKEDDFHSIWRVATNYVVSPANQAAVVQKLRVKQHLMDDHDALRDVITGMTPLHIIGATAGDPAFAKLLLSTGWKAFDPDLLDEEPQQNKKKKNNNSVPDDVNAAMEEETHHIDDNRNSIGKGETPLIKLLQRPAVHDPDGPWHNRTVTLMEVFIKFAGASLGIQSSATGDTATHLAVRHHAYGGKILPFLLSVGGGHATILAMRNNKGLTPEEELTTTTTSSSPSKTTTTSSTPSSSSGLQKFLKSGKDEALKLLQKCDKELVQERAQNRFKVRGLPLYQGRSYGGGGGGAEDSIMKNIASRKSRQDNHDHGQQQQEKRSPSRQMKISTDILIGGNGNEYQPDSLKQPAPDLVVWDNELSKTERKIEEEGGDQNSNNDDENNNEDNTSSSVDTPTSSTTTSNHRSYRDDDDTGDGIRRPIVRAKLARLVFNKYDSDQDGFISRNALLHALHSYDSIGLPQQAVDSVVESIGICSDGRVNFDEFALILLKLQSRG